MPTISIKVLSKNLDKVIEEVANNSTLVLVTNSKGKNCYLINEEALNSMLETIHLNSIEGLSDSIIEEGKTQYSNTTNSDDIDWN